MLKTDQIAAFVTDGFVRLDHAFAPATAQRCCEILWREMHLDPDRPETWTQPVVRIGDRSEAPFVEAANTPRLHAAFDQLVGVGRWQPRGSLGTFPVRFPSQQEAGDTGWHIDVSLNLGDADFMQWRANIRSDGRALLMLFLFTEVGPHDAPTRIRIGSHRDIARRLAPAGDAGLSLRELAADGFRESAHRDEILATGGPGTVYLCHPFLVHAAQAHDGTRPRIIAQPPLLPTGRFSITHPRCPVEIAIADSLRPSA